MAQYFTDFSEYTTSAQPSDWTARWVTTGVTWEVREDAGATGGKLLFHERPSGSGRSALSWDAIDSDGDRDDVEIVFKWRSTGSATSRMVALARGSGSAASETGYVHGWSYGSFSGVAASKYDGGTFSRFGEDAQSAISANTWQITRVRINGTTHQVKHWLAADSEPGTWDVEATDSSITAAGWVGLMQFSNLPDYEVDWFGVGTNGDSAPTEAPAGGGVSGTGTGTLSALTGAASGVIEITGLAAGALQAVTAAAAGHLSYTGTAAATLAAATGAASGTTGTGTFGTGAAVLAQVTGGASGYLSYTGTGAGLLTALRGAASGTFSGADFFGQGRAVLASLTGNASGQLGYSGAGIASLPTLTGGGAGVIEITGAGAGVFPTITGAAVGVLTGTTPWTIVPPASTVWTIQNQASTTWTIH